MKKLTCTCGRKFTPKNKNQKYHSEECKRSHNTVFCRNCGCLIEDDQDVLFCSEECRRQHDGNPSRELSSTRRNIECTCPKCGIKHKKKMNWKGRGKPKVFCEICRHYAGFIDEEMELECTISRDPRRM